MHRTRTRPDPRQRGFTLTEVLVATAIFALIFVAALLIYDRANKVFRTGVEGADMQQNARVAFDRLVADLRMAGFDYDRDGVPASVGTNVWRKTSGYGIGSTVSPIIYNGFTYRCIAAGTSGNSEPTWNTTINGTTPDNTITWRTLEGVNSYQQPDEQIEYAGTHAITIRANFDHDLNKANGYGREANLESVSFPLVTTGNDEIVTYALQSEAVDDAGAPLAGINPNTIRFFADLPDRRAFPGGRAERPVTIGDVDLCATGCNMPPYTLYRYTLDAAGNVAPGTPIATNIRSLQFTYYADVSGTTPLVIADPGGGQYNANTPGTSLVARAARSAIRAVRLELVAMNEAPDAAYTNPDEIGTLAENYRTYRVESLVVPRNLGKQGMREQQNAPPGKPKMERVCINACRMALVEWDAPVENPDLGVTEQYGITYGTTAQRGEIQIVGAVTSAWIDNLIPGEDYWFSVSAINGFGSTPADDPATTADDDTSVVDIPGSATAGAGYNRTTSNPVTLLRASGGDIVLPPASPAEQPNKITIGWTLPLFNVSATEDLLCYDTNETATTHEKPPAVPIATGEIREWEVRRGTLPNFDPEDPLQYTVVPTTTPNTLASGLTTATLVDKTAANCVDYYYRIRSKEACPIVGGVDWTKAPGSNTSAWFPAFGTAAVKGRSSAADVPIAPISLLGENTCIPSPPPVGAEYNPGSEVCNHLVWPKVKTDTAVPIENEIVVDTYQIEIARYRKPTLGTYAFDAIITTPLLPGGSPNPDFVADPNGTNWLREDAEPTTGILYTSAPGKNYLVAKHPASDVGNNDTFAYQYTIRALQCPNVDPPALPADYTLASDPSPAFRFPCDPSGTSTLAVTDVLDGNGATEGTAFLVQSGTSTVVVNGTNIESVQVYLTDLNDTTIADLGTISTPPFVFPITGTQDGEIYRARALVKDTNGCTNVISVYVEEATATGCCLAAVANDQFVVQYTAGRREMDVFLRNECSSSLDIQASGIRFTWDPSTTTPGTVLQSVVFPGGGVQTVNNTNGDVVTSVPSPGLTSVPAESQSYNITLRFSEALVSPGVNGPLTGFCVTYRRPSLDTENQNCRIVLEPVIFNSCSP